jgi:hypothetical protein
MKIQEKCYFNLVTVDILAKKKKVATKIPLNEIEQF